VFGVVEMVHGTSSSKRFKRVKLVENRAGSASGMQASGRGTEIINPFLYAPEEIAQQRRRHGGCLIAPAQFVPLDSARRKQHTPMTLRKKQLSRAATEAERNAEIAKALSKAVRRERRAKDSGRIRTDGGTDPGVSVRHVVSVSDVIFASPEAAQVLCGEDIEWVDDDDDESSLTSEESARRKRRDLLRYRAHTVRKRSAAHAHPERLRSALKTRK